MQPSSIPALRAAFVAMIVCGLIAVAERAADAKCSPTKEVPIGAGKTKQEPRVGKPERAFGGQVLTSKKRFPTYARSVASYISAVRKQVERKFWENTTDKSWKIHFIAFFKKPHDDMEVSIRLWDISTGTKHMLSTFEQYVDRCATSYASSMDLKRADFGVNKEILITVESRNVVIASGKFKILGEGEKYKGKVDFTDDDDDTGAKPKGDDDEGDDDDDDDDGAATAARDTAEPPPEEDPEAFDLNDPALDKAPSLDPRTEMTNEPPKTQKSSRGCGCATGADHSPGAILLFALVWGVLRRRPSFARR